MRTVLLTIGFVSTLILNLYGQIHDQEKFTELKNSSEIVVFGELIEKKQFLEPIPKADFHHEQNQGVLHPERGTQRDNRGNHGRGRGRRHCPAMVAQHRISRQGKRIFFPPFHNGRRNNGRGIPPSCRPRRVHPSENEELPPTARILYDDRHHCGVRL